jgi:hypothetical protein
MSPAKRFPNRSHLNHVNCLAPHRGLVTTTSGHNAYLQTQCKPRIASRVEIIFVAETAVRRTLSAAQPINANSVHFLRSRSSFSDIFLTLSLNQQDLPPFRVELKPRNKRSTCIKESDEMTAELLITFKAVPYTPAAGMRTQLPSLSKYLYGSTCCPK